VYDVNSRKRRKIPFKVSRLWPHLHYLNGFNLCHAVIIDSDLLLVVVPIDVANKLSYSDAHVRVLETIVVARPAELEMGSPKKTRATTDIFTSCSYPCRPRNASLMEPGCGGLKNLSRTNHATRWPS
jgi:hypothetical protein